MKHPYLNLRTATYIFLTLNILDLLGVFLCGITFTIFRALFDDLLDTKLFEDFSGSLETFILIFITVIIIKSGFSIWLSLKSLKGIRWSQMVILILSGISCILYIILVVEYFSKSMILQLIPLLLNGYVCITMLHFRQETA